MIREYMTFMQGQFLSETEEFKNGTPSNYIIFKKLPGLGATHGECLKYNRNSIIIEPNVPVLEGKRDALDSNGDKMHPDILVVYKGISKNMIKDYLNGPVSHKKILSTPEGYKKVKKAIEESSFDLYEDFFLLYDECDRLIKDVDYRGNILLPMEDFFKFKNKAMISATALEPSDERFAQQNFKILEVVPNYDYKRDIQLIQTNNILFTLDKEFKKDPDGVFFVFINSVKLIHVLIERLNIEHESKIFCAEKSITYLESEAFDIGSSKLTNFAKFNFLTSRNFSAVDIKLDYKPNVILVTDTLRKCFTMLDPFTDSTQILGRFRNGFRTATHITNFNKIMCWLPEEEAKQYIKDAFKCFLELSAVSSRNSSNPGGLDTGRQALHGTQIKYYVNGDLTLNKYMLDNFVLDQAIRSYYVDADSLELAYERTGSFNLNYTKQKYKLSDFMFLKIEEDSKSPFAIEVVAMMLQKATFPIDPEAEILAYDDDTFVRKIAPVISNIFDLVGYQNMEKLNFI